MVQIERRRLGDRRIGHPDPAGRLAGCPGPGGKPGIGAAGTMQVAV